jgi:hypothetical protein
MIIREETLKKIIEDALMEMKTILAKKQAEEAAEPLKSFETPELEEVKPE